MFGRCVAQVLLDPQGGVVSTSVTSKGKKDVQLREDVRHMNKEKPTDLFTEREFMENFYVP